MMSNYATDVNKHIVSVLGSLSAMIEQQWAAIDLCLGKQLIGPALILIYSAIDSMASLDLETSKQFVTRADFKRWVKRYLLPYGDFTCDADDLYSARCGLLHSYSPASRPVLKGEAVTVWYAWGDADEKAFQQMVDSSGQSVKVIHIRRLFEALVRGTAIYLGEVQQDSDRLQKVFMRAQKLMLFLPQGDAKRAYEQLFGNSGNN